MSLYPLHAELEALIWAMHCMIAQRKTMVAFATDDFEVVKIVSILVDWPMFSIYLEEFANSNERFIFLTVSLISCTLNTKTYKIAKNARTYPSGTIYVNFVLLFLCLNHFDFDAYSILIFFPTLKYHMS